MHYSRTLALLAVGAMTISACQSDLTGRTAAGEQALALGYEFETHRQCDGEVARQLQLAGIGPDAVDAIWYEDQKSLVPGKEDQIIGYDSYTRIVGQPGLFVVDMTRECITQQVYTRDGLSLPGISAF